MIKKRYWHYTVFVYLKEIFNDETIKTTDLYIPKGVRPVAWFSTNIEWEPTILKSIEDDAGDTIELIKRSDYRKYGHPLVRIEVCPKTANLHSYNNYKKKSGESRQSIKALEKVAKELGASPKDWHVSYDNVSASCFLSVEIWDGNAWIDLKTLSKEDQLKLQEPHALRVCPG